MLTEKIKVGHVRTIDGRHFGEKLFALFVSQYSALVGEVLRSHDAYRGELVGQELEAGRTDSHKASDDDSGHRNSEYGDGYGSALLKKIEDRRRCFRLTLLPLFREKAL